MSDLYCWFDFKDGHTCMLPKGHDGPHEPTSDDDIMIRLADPQDGIFDAPLPLNDH